MLMPPIFEKHREEEEEKREERSGSELVADGDPVVSQVVSPGKELEIPPVRDQLLDHFVDSLRFLGLTSPLSENHIRADRGSAVGWILPLLAHQTRLLGVLQIVPVTLGHPPIHSLLNPVNAVHVPVTREGEGEV